MDPALPPRGAPARGAAHLPVRRPSRFFRAMPDRLVDRLLHPGSPLVIAHRGDRAHHPENTLGAFRQALAHGPDALELDVHLSADGEVVVIHDPTLDRTCDRTGAVAALRWEELQGVDAGARFTTDRGRSFPFRGAGHAIPRFADLLEEFASLPLLIEIKTPAAALPLRHLIERAGAAGRVAVASMHAAAVAPFRGSAIAVGATRDDAIRLYAMHLTGRRPRRVPYAFAALTPSYYGLPVPVRRFARLLAPLGVPMHVWTVNDPAVAERFWRGGVTGIVTDDPRLLLDRRAALALTSR